VLDEKMLQTRNSLVSPDTVPPEFHSPVVSLADVVDFIRRHLRITLLMCLVAWGVAILYLIAAVPVFTSGAELVIKSRAPLGDVASVSTMVETQIAIIKSESIARAVIQKLDLTGDPEFVGRNGVVSSTIGSLARLLGRSKPELESSPIRYALEIFQRNLSVKRVGLTYIIAMSFESTDPERAAQILNTVAQTYITHQMDAKYSILDEAWVKDQLTELSSGASAAQRALENYRKDRKGTADPVDAGAERALVAAAESSKNAYDNFQHVVRQMEAARQQSAPMFGADLISMALPPLRPSSPKNKIVLGLSTIAGVLLGIAIGVLRDLSDHSRAGARTWKEFQVTCIAVIPRAKSNGVWKRLKAVFTGLAQLRPTNSASAKSPAFSIRNGPASIVMASTDGGRVSERALSNPASTDYPRSREIVRTKSPIWTVTDAPQSPFTKSFLEIKLAIDSMTRSGKKIQVIGITSTRPNEGKSTVAAALALLMAHTGARVVLLDCNLRNRSLSAELAPTATSGILDGMTGAVSLPAITWTDPLSRLAFIPAGNSSRPIYASDALASETLDKLFGALRKSYEYVIVDLPALTPFADVRAAAHLLDSFILVVEWGRTNVGVVERALNACSDLDEIMLGVTLNKAKPRS
jgi:capsular exopolysaccharide synthesis family protein